MGRCVIRGPRMRILILGGDGYLGWPTGLRLSSHGHEVALADNFLRRRFHTELGTDSLTPIRTLDERIAAWRMLSGRTITPYVGDITDWPFLTQVVTEWRPDAVVHFAEQPSAPYSMIDHDHAVFTQMNNVVGTLNVMFALRDNAPACHLVK